MGKRAISADEPSSYYSAQAYRPNAIPGQPRQKQELNHSRIGQSAGFRLPWGNTRDVVAPIVFSRIAPKALRRYEKRGDYLDGTGFQGRADHECMRHARLAFRSRFLNKLGIFGKGFFWILLPLVFVTYLSFVARANNTETWFTVLDDYLPSFALIMGGPALMWLVSTTLFNLFPKWCVKAGRGPEWEINRRTGLVTVWSYPRKRLFRKREEPTVTHYPFYEFDGWVRAAADRFGPRYDFVLCHRYKKLEVHLGEMLSLNRFPNACYAHWDFIQNYMDVTRPLPDIPQFELYRHLDPVTAEHDRSTSRPARYWRDMDDKTFREKEDEMHRKVKRIDTERRPNLMADKVRYAFRYTDEGRTFG